MSHLPETTGGSLTGLTPEAAKAFHGYFVFHTITFATIMLVAHTLVWFWKPWFTA